LNEDFRNGFYLSFPSSPHQGDCTTTLINIIVLLEELFVVQRDSLDKLFLPLKDKSQDSLSVLSIQRMLILGRSFGLSKSGEGTEVYMESFHQREREHQVQTQKYIKSSLGILAGLFSLGLEEEGGDAFFVLILEQSTPSARTFWGST
jgi:hypothetical protein